MRGQQTVSVTNNPHTLSLQSERGIHVKVTQGATVIIDTDAIGKYSYTFTPVAGNVVVELSDDANDNFDIGWIQLEENPFNTSYTSTSRGDGILTVPLQFNSNNGSIFFRFSPQSSIVSTNRVLLEYGDLRIKYNNTEVFIERGTTEIASVAIGVSEEEWYSLLATWNGSYVKLSVSGIYSESNSFAFTPGSFLRVGHSENSAEYRGNSLIDDLYILSSYNDSVELFEMNAVDRPLVYLSFDGTVSKFDNTVIELQPANKNFAPINIVKEDGTVMRRIAFTDPASGEYITYAAETMECNGDNIFEVPFKEVDTEIFKPFALDIDDNRIEVIEISGNKITLDIDGKAYNGQTLTLFYQPKDIFTVEYTNDDMFRIMLGKHDGQAVTITYETENYNDVRLLTNIDLNAMNNPNHDGFVYLTKDVYEVETLNMIVYPKEIKADGVSKGIILIDAKDKYGNIVTDVTFNLEAEYGTITPPPAGQPMEVSLQEQAGRYIFEFTAPLINASFDGYILSNIIIRAYQNNELVMSTETSIKLLSV